jgi:hypothetical protein
VFFDGLRPYMSICRYVFSFRKLVTLTKKDGCDFHVFTLYKVCKDLMIIIIFVDKHCHLKINNSFVHVFLTLPLFRSLLCALGSLIKNLSQCTCRLFLVQIPRFACSLGSIMSAAVCMNTEVGLDMP